MVRRAASRPKISQASLEVKLVAPKRILDAVKASMIPEVRKSERSDFAIRIAKDNSLILLFKARDLVALRAGFNTNLRLVSSALKTIESAEKLQRRNFAEQVKQKD